MLPCSLVLFVVLAMVVVSGCTPREKEDGPESPAPVEPDPEQQAAAEREERLRATTAAVEAGLLHLHRSVESAEAVAQEEGERVRALTGEMIAVGAGTFLIGSPPRPARRSRGETQPEVTLTRDFRLGRYPVVQAQYEAVMGENPSRFPECGETCPVGSVSWLNAVEFVNALNEQLGLPACYDNDGRVVGGESVYACEGYRLPTEAEWEIAVRAGSEEVRYGPLDDVAWYRRNSGERPQPVGLKEPNDWGFHDMLGNHFEWVHDWYAPRLEGGVDPAGPPSGWRMVLRGGSYVRSGSMVTAAYRAGPACNSVWLAQPERVDRMDRSRNSHRQNRPEQLNMSEEAIRSISPRDLTRMPESQREALQWHYGEMTHDRGPSFRCDPDRRDWDYGFRIARTVQVSPER